MVSVSQSKVGSSLQTIPLTGLGWKRFFEPSECNLILKGHESTCRSSRRRKVGQKNSLRKTAKHHLYRKPAKRNISRALGCGKVKNCSDLEETKQKPWNALIHDLSGNTIYKNGFPICFVTLPLTVFSSHSPNYKKISIFKVALNAD